MGHSALALPHSGIAHVRNSFMYLPKVHGHILICQAYVSAVPHGKTCDSPNPWSLHLASYHLGILSPLLCLSFPLVPPSTPHTHTPVQFEMCKELLCDLHFPWGVPPLAF